MAKTAVTSLVDKLQQLLCAEATILGGVHDEVNHIKDQLQLINSFLKDADRLAEAESTSDVVKTWVNQLREVAFRMEDVVDHYLLEVVERGQRHGVFRIASEISKIKESIKRLNEIRETLNFEASANTTATPRRYPRLGAHFVEESQLVGIKHNKKVLTDWLISRESRRSVMVVIGPGGIGKTTIVKNVYDRQKTSFGCYAWITVSRIQGDYKMLLIRAVIQSIQKEHPDASAALRIEATDLLSLTNKVKEYLKDKRYLIVFDDLWDSIFWNAVQYAIPDGSKGSRVIITTRDEGVASSCRREGAVVDVHRLEALPLNDALKLFHQKAFQFEQQGDRQELKKLSEDIVKKCSGMPLAILAIAGLLSTKEKTISEWKKVHDRLGSILASDQRVQKVMSESYHDLPTYLKACFLYFGLFPEDYSISCKRLIRLWVAEGFVNGTVTENISIEEVADEYLDDLFRRCLVQVSRVDFDGKPKSCRVHDLMHKFILRKCEEQNFCQVMIDSITQPISRLDSVGRRLSIHRKNNENANMQRAVNWNRVRSCFVFDDAKNWLVEKPFFSSFELLIGLDLCDARLDHLPEQVGELLNLKYLSLRHTNIKSLPKSIGKLVNLQTLDLKQTQVHELPEEIKNLIKLRHLLAYYVNNQHTGLDSLQGVKLEKGLQNLTSLQKLSFWDTTNAATANIIEELNQLRQLRKLGIKKLTGQYGEALCRAIENMTHLCSLSIGAMKNHEILELQSLKNPPLSLQRLYLYGRLESFPNWIPKLQNLVRLYLKWSGLQEDPLPYFKDLSELIQLELYDTYGGVELHFKNGWFKGLKILHLESMPNLKTIKIDKEALPRLEQLKIGKCGEMVQLPSDLKNLTSLKRLFLYEMKEQFIKGIQEGQGEVFEIVNKIPLVLYSNDDHFPTLHSLNDENDDDNW